MLYVIIRQDIYTILICFVSGIFLTRKKGRRQRHSAEMGQEYGENNLCTWNAPERNFHVM